jgi:hypothetical protein
LDFCRVAIPIAAWLPGAFETEGAKTYVAVAGRQRELCGFWATAWMSGSRCTARMVTLD